MASRRILGALLAGVLAGLRDPVARRRDLDDEERAWIVAMSICDELHPLGPLVVPARGSAEDHLAREVRDASIWEEFDGRNYQALAAKHRLSEMQVRRIVERARRSPRTLLEVLGDHPEK